MKKYYASYCVNFVTEQNSNHQTVSGDMNFSTDALTLQTIEVCKASILEKAQSAVKSKIASSSILFYCFIELAD